MAAKIRKNDEVILTTGSEKNGKGKHGKVLEVLPNGKVIVEGINMITKHERPVPQLNKTGGRVQKEAPVDVSNVAIFNPDTQKADKVGFRKEDGKLVRFYKSTNQTII